MKRLRSYIRRVQVYIKANQIEEQSQHQQQFLEELGNAGLLTTHEGYMLQANRAMQCNSPGLALAIIREGALLEETNAAECQLEVNKHQAYLEQHNEVVDYLRWQGGSANA